MPKIIQTNKAVKESHANHKDEGTMSIRKKEVIGSINSRLNRLISFNGPQSSSAAKIKNTLTDEELYQAGFIFAPITGLYPTWLRRANVIYIASITRKDRFAGFLRAIAIDAINTFRLDRKVKDTLIDVTLKGMTSDQHYTQAVGIGLDNIKSKRKSDLKNDIKTDIKYNMILSGFFQASTEGGDAFELARAGYAYGNATYDFVKDVEKDSYFKVKELGKIINMMACDKAELNSTPIAINGFLSNYSNTKEKMKGKTKNEILAHVFCDIAAFADVDLGELEIAARDAAKEVKWEEAKEDYKQNSQ